MQSQEAAEKEAERIKWMLTALEDAQDLTQWEAEFLESVTGQFEERGRLTARQVETLTRIYNERGSDG